MARQAMQEFARSARAATADFGSVRGVTGQPNRCERPRPNDQESAMTEQDSLPPFSDSFEEMFRRIFGPLPARPQSTGAKGGKAPAPQPSDAPPGDDHE
jgi:hypothetical protein